jgi:hypothetical protein
LPIFSSSFIIAKEYIEDGRIEPIDREPMLLLKMTCASTGHIHILRVPPEMTSAEAVITWVNHGMHPDRFTVQTYSTFQLYAVGYW